MPKFIMPSEVRNGMRYTYKKGYTIIRPSKFKPYPLFCPICKFHMSGLDDIQAYKKFECCQQCMFSWAESRATAWIEEDWRPSEDEVVKEKKKRIESLRNLSLDH